MSKLKRVNNFGPFIWLVCTFVAVSAFRETGDAWLKLKRGIFRFIPVWSIRRGSRKFIKHLSIFFNPMPSQFTRTARGWGVRHNAIQFAICIWQRADKEVLASLWCVALTAASRRPRTGGVPAPGARLPGARLLRRPPSFSQPVQRGHPPAPERTLLSASRRLAPRVFP